MKEDIDELKIPYTFYYKTIWYVLAILGTGVFTTTNLKKSQENIRKIKDFDWSVEIKNKSGEETFKDKYKGKKQLEEQKPKIFKPSFAGLPLG